MSIEDNLFWVLQESDIHNEEIYLPSDTPIGKVNPQRLYTILQKRHARQNQRLLLKQVHELEEYQKNFAAKYKDELPTASSTTACQLIDGNDFLQEHNDMISELLSASPIIANEEDIEDMNSISKDLKPIQDQPRKHSESRIKRKHRHGFDDLDYDHYYQRQKLKEFQKQDVSIIPPEIIHATKKSSASDTRKSKHNERKKRRHSTDEEDNDDKKSKSMSPMHPTTRIPPVSNRNLIPNVHTKPLFMARPNGPPTVVASSNKPPIVASSGPPTVVSSSNKPPFVSRSNRPPTIQIASKSKPSDHPKAKSRTIHLSNSKGPDSPSTSNHATIAPSLKEKKRRDNSLKHPKDITFTNKNQRTKTRPPIIDSTSVTSHPIKIEPTSFISHDQTPNVSKNAPSNRKSRWNHSSSDKDMQPSSPTSSKTFDKSTPKQDTTSASRDSHPNLSLRPTVQPTLDADKDKVPLQTAKRRRFTTPPTKDSSRANTNKKSRLNSPSEPSDSSSSRPVIAESPRKPRWNAPHSRESSTIVNSSPQGSRSNSPLHRNREEAVSTAERSSSRWNVPSSRDSLPIVNSSSKGSLPNSPSQSTGSSRTVAASIVESAQTIISPLNRAYSPTSSHTIDASFNGSRPKSPSQSNNDNRTVAAPTINMSLWNVPLPSSDREYSPVRSPIEKSPSKDNWSSSSINNSRALAAPTVEPSQLSPQPSQEPTMMDSSSKDSRPNSPSKTQKKPERKSRWNVPPTPPVTVKTEPSSGDNAQQQSVTAPTTATPTTSTRKIPTSRFRSNQLSNTSSNPFSSATPVPRKKPSHDTEASPNPIQLPSSGGGFRFQPPKAPSTRRIAAPTFGNAPSHMIWSAPPEPTVDADKIHELLGIDRLAPAPESAIIDADKIHALLGIDRPAPAPINIPPNIANTRPSVEIPPRPRSRPNKNNAPSRAIAPPTIQTSTSNQPPTIESTNNDRRRSSGNSPLFIDNRSKHKSKVFSLMDNGQIVIRSKPNRVVIKGVDGTSKAYGDPKDYDDAINGIYRATNPVYKRMMDRTQYLFFKQESGGVVTIGPVSKIQPLIHKFFLAR